MKNIFVAAVILFCAIGTMAQTPRSNPGLDSLKAIKDPAALEQKIQALENGSESDMIVLLNYYGRNRKVSDSLTKIALKRFPKGKIEMNERHNNAYEEKDPNVQEKLYWELKKDYPQGNFGRVALMLAYNYAQGKNSLKSISFLKQLEGRDKLNAFSVIFPMIMAYDPANLESYVDQALADASTIKDERIALFGIQSQLLTKRGDFKNGFSAMKAYYEMSARKSADMTARYYYLLSKNGGEQEAFPFLEHAVNDGIGGEEIKDELKSSFTKLNPGKSSDAYISNLEAKYQQRLIEEIKAKMISEPAPNFNVTDISGKKVSLSDFKNKIVVLDFWATWCGPCKRSLPAMQMAVNKYTSDPNVKFLFIHTWENVADPTTDAKKYFKDNNYDLPLYMDLKDKTSNKNPAVSAFDVKGIPAKFVIDGNGNIRFKMSGFGGTNEAAVAELTTMIELSRGVS